MGHTSIWIGLLKTCGMNSCFIMSQYNCDLDAKDKRVMNHVMDQSKVTRMYGKSSIMKMKGGHKDSAKIEFQCVWILTKIFVTFTL